MDRSDFLLRPHRIYSAFISAALRMVAVGAAASSLSFSWRVHERFLGTGPTNAAIHYVFYEKKGRRESKIDGLGPAIRAAPTSTKAHPDTTDLDIFGKGSLFELLSYRQDTLGKNRLLQNGCKGPALRRRNRLKRQRRRR